MPDLTELAINDDGKIVDKRSGDSVNVLKSSFPLIWEYDKVRGENFGKEDIVRIMASIRGLDINSYLVGERKIKTDEVYTAFQLFKIEE
tara:strand:+ start:241 stop:507 length:267 start_codon:yes stop_codon:yes gene_type:complete